MAPAPTLVFLSSAVISSNSSFNLNLASVVLKVLWDFIDITPSSMLNSKLGFAIFPICRVAKPTPVKQTDIYLINFSEVLDRHATWSFIKKKTALFNKLRLHLLPSYIHQNSHWKSSSKFQRMPRPCCKFELINTTNHLNAHCFDSAIITFGQVVKFEVSSSTCLPMQANQVLYLVLPWQQRG